jgi:LysM repeat protein
VRLLAVSFATAALLVAPAVARASTNPQIAGLQVALRAHGLYLGQIDGVSGPRTARALHAFQRKVGIRVGIVDLRTRHALGPLGTPLFGSRVLKRGDFGWDVSVLQYLLTRSGVYTGALDGYLGAQTDAALKRYQRTLRLRVDGVVGTTTLAAIVHRERVPVRVRRPVPKAPTFVHVVKVGDTLTAIAKKAGTTIAAIAAVNRIDPARPILIGQRLHLPEAAAALAPQSGAVQTLLDKWSGAYGVDQHLVRALAWMESGYQTRIVSSAGARGVLQTLPTTRDYVETVLLGRSIPESVDGDVEVGVLYLKHLLHAFRGNERLALAAWYQGERAVREHGVYPESKPFVANVLALRARM